MTVLVLGPNGSGKSAYAERLVMRLSAGAPYYIATMIPYGEEGQARVEKHRKQRKGMGFITLEQPVNVSDITITPEAAVLLEDASNLLGNAMFAGERGGGATPARERGGSATPVGERSEDATPASEHGGSAESVFADIAALCKKCRAAVLVSIGGLAEQPEHDEETRGYIDALNRLNEKLAGFSDAVIVMRDGTPVFVKGDANALD